MVEMTIGSRFWYKDKLCEVVENESEFKCVGCVIYGDRKNCGETRCFGGNRHDGHSIFFKEVKE